MDGILDRLVDDEEVEGGSPVFEVPDVELDAPFHLPELAGLATEAVDLGPAGDAGFDEVAHHVLLDEVGVLVGVLEHVGAGTYDGHLAQKDVDELGQFVDAGLADELAYARLARIVEGGLHAVGVGIDAHGAELVAPELTPVDARALLTEEDGTGRRQLDGRAHDEVYKGKGGTEEKAGEQDVEQAFEQAVLDIGQRFAPDGEHGGVAHELHVHAALEVVADTGNAVEMDEMVLAVVDDGEYLRAVGGGKTAVDHLDAVLADPGKGVVDVAQIGDIVRIDQRRGRGEVAHHAETVGRVDGDFAVELVHVLVRTDEDDGAGVSAVAAITLDDGPEQEPVRGQADEEGHIERNEETEREVTEIGQREEGTEGQGMDQHVAGRTAHDVVGAHDAVVQDDSVGIITDEVDQIEQNENLGDGVYKDCPQRPFIEQAVEKHKQEIHDTEISKNNDILQ